MLKDCNIIPVETCSICSKDSWCMEFVNEAGLSEAFLCHRVPSDKPAKTGNGYIHFPDGNTTTTTYIKTPPPPKERKACTRMTSKVLKDLWDMTTLNDTHKDQLLARGLKDLTKYRSYPSYNETKQIMKQLSQRYTDAEMLTVAGFYRTDNGGVWMRSAKNATLIPCKNERGEMIGAQIRHDDGTKGSKYTWLSVNRRKRRKGGSKAGLRLHVAHHPQTHITQNEKSKELYLTEGILKADLVSQELGMVVLGIAGVSAYDRSELKNTINKQLALRGTVNIAFDNDRFTNNQVAKALDRLAKHISSWGFKVRFCEWDSNYKGLDDYLVSAGTPEIGYEPYSPPISLNSMRSVPTVVFDDDGEVVRENGKIVKKIQEKIRIIDSNFVPEEVEVDLEGLRNSMGTRITDFAVNGGGKGLLMRAIPGLGKTHTSRIVLESLADKGTLRPVFAMPRHDLMVNLKDWKRIRPRQPRLHEQRSIPLPILQNRIEDAIEEAHVTGQVNYGTLPSLCHQWERANQLASRGWNVVSNLCMTDCSIGMGDCLYFNQFEQTGRLATVHETLFIPRFCNSIFGQEEENVDGWQDTIPRLPSVAVIDEPSPSKWIKTIEIGSEDLTKAIETCWSDDVLALLKLVREGYEAFVRDMGGLRTVGGKDLIDILIKTAGDRDVLDELVRKCDPDKVIKNETVLVKFDSLTVNRKSNFSVSIAGENYYIDSAKAKIRAKNLLEVEKVYALIKELPIHSEFDESEGVPLNFQSDLVRVLDRELSNYDENGYNSSIYFDVQEGIRLNLKNELAVPSHVPLICLDGQGDPKLLEMLTGRPFDVWSYDKLPDTSIVQIVDGAYGVTSLWNSKTKTPKFSLDKLLDTIVLPKVTEKPEKCLIVTWKVIADYLKTLQDTGELSGAVGIEHYGNLRGSNEYEDRETVILLGTPNINTDQLEEQVNALFIGGDRVNMDTHRVWEQYDYRDSNGKGYQVQVRRYQDERVERMARIYRENEMVQAAHRVRPVVNSGNREVIILSNIPIPQLAPTHLTSAEDLSKSSMPIDPRSIKSNKVLLREATRIAKEVMFENGYIRAELLEPALRLWFDNYANKNTFDENVEPPSLSGFPVLRTLERWVKNIANEEGWDSLRCTVTNRYDFNGTGTVNVVVYHDGTVGIEEVLECAKTDYLNMKNISTEDAEDLLFEWELFEKGLNPEDFPVVERGDPPSEEVPDWFENI